VMYCFMEIATFIFLIAILIMSVVVHEVSHGFIALALGDFTAKYAGRLTLNPLKHLDPVGSFLFPALLVMLGVPPFGWARPVPYNPYNLRDQKWGPALVAVAGPLSNILVAFVFGMMFRFAAISEVAASTAFLTLLVVVIYINILLAVFNLIPIPPLDGSKILFAVLPHRYLAIQRLLEAYGFFILLILIFIGRGILGLVILPPTFLLAQLLTGLSPQELLGALAAFF